MTEDQILQARLKDLANRAYKQNTYTYSGFLTPAELALLDEIKSEISYVDYTTFGGAEICERQMVGFGSEEMFGYPGSFPIAVIKVEPLIEKFSDDLSHRDFLGAIMNLGIERNILGDILVKEKKRAYIFCQENIAEYIIENLTKIRHTNVRCAKMDVNSEEEVEELKPELVDLHLIVAAPRFDAILAAAIKCSRNEALQFFRAKKVTLNGRICERNSMSLKPGDIFSVRGYGKYRFESAGAETRKGRINLYLKQYK